MIFCKHSLYDLKKKNLDKPESTSKFLSCFLQLKMGSHNINHSHNISSSNGYIHLQKRIKSCCLNMNSTDKEYSFSIWRRKDWKKKACRKMTINIASVIAWMSTGHTFFFTFLCCLIFGLHKVNTHILQTINLWASVFFFYTSGHRKSALNPNILNCVVNLQLNRRIKTTALITKISR